MIRDKRMKYLKEEEGIDFYLFSPSVFRLYYDSRKDDAPHRHYLSHLLHMFIYVLRGGYNILYLAKNDEIISYIIFTKCDDRIIEGAESNSFYTIFLWTYERYRGQGIGYKMADFMLHHFSKEYNAFYKTTAKHNSASIALAEKAGFVRVSDAKKVGHLHRVVPSDNGDLYLYCYKKSYE